MAIMGVGFFQGQKKVYGLGAILIQLVSHVIMFFATLFNVPSNPSSIASHTFPFLLCFKPSYRGCLDGAECLVLGLILVTPRDTMGRV